MTYRYTDEIVAAMTEAEYEQHREAIAIEQARRMNEPDGTGGGAGPYTDERVAAMSDAEYAQHRPAIIAAQVAAMNANHRWGM